jgi:tRNA modification GTPase
LKSCLAHCEAVIDFGDDDRENDIDDSDMWVLTPRVEVLCREMKKHLDDNNRGEIIRDGVRVALVGPPNAGKSSLLNMLAKRPAAIVSPVAGTTRDVVEVRMDFNGVSCIVSDIAGITLNNNDNKPIEVNGQLVEDSVDNIFYSSDAIEFEGMRRAKDVYLSSHVRILICDASDKTSVDNTLALLNTLQAIQTPFEDLSNNDSNITTPDHLLKFIHKPCDGRSRDKLGKTIVIFNKTDLKFNETYSNEKIRFLTQDLNIPSSSISFLSCSTGEGLSGLEASLSSMINNLIGDDGGNGDESTGMSLGEGELITRTRHRQHVAQCVKHLEKFTNEDLLMDTAAEELR